VSQTAMGDPAEAAQEYRESIQSADDKDPEPGQPPSAKKLRERAWRLGGLLLKPGEERLFPEQFKRDHQNFSSKVVHFCGDQEYMAIADWKDRAARYWEECNRRIEEVQETEKEIKSHNAKNCYQAIKTEDGRISYAVQQQYERPERTYEADPKPLKSSTKDSSVDVGIPAGPRWSLRGKGVADSDIDAVVKGLQSYPGVTTLDLQENDIMDAGVQALVAALSTGTAPNLEELRIGGNGFGDLGLTMLQQGLRIIRGKISVSLDVLPAEEAEEPANSPEERPNNSSAALPLEECMRPEVGQLMAPVEETPGPAEPAAADFASSSSATAEIVDGRVKVVAILPEGVSTGDVDLLVNPRVLRLQVHQSALSVDLPAEVQVDSAKAKFSSKTHKMTVILELA